MEFVEAFLDEERESLSKMFSVGENNPDLSLFLSSDSNCDHENKANESSFIFPFCNDHRHTSLHTNFYNLVSQESSNIIDDGVNFYHPQHHHEDLTNNTFDECMNYYATMTVPVSSDDVIMEDMFNNEQSGGGNNEENDDCCKEVIQLKRNYEAEAEADEEEEPTAEEYRSLQRHKRKPRVSRNNKNQKAANNQSKKKKKTIKDDENNNEEKTIDGGGGNNQSTSSCSSEDHDSIVNASESKLGKAKANRGSATDPQSLYARRRRERINERLKILQNLVPNGTKVDISTMLEEAVQYVKFLQLQIKLLSSDDLWMYAPIAYNGMDISMYHKISPNFCL